MVSELFIESLDDGTFIPRSNAMTAYAQHKMMKLVGLLCAISLLTGEVSIFSQEKISPLSSYQYTKKDKPQYDAIAKEADVQKRADLLLAFVKERAISQLLLNAASDYMACVKPQLDNKDWAKAISMEEALWAALPTVETVKAAGIPEGVDEYLSKHLIPTQKLLLTGLVQAYLQSNNLPKGAEAAEKLYALSPDKGVLELLANIYLGMKNYDKYLECGKKILTDTPIEQGYPVALQMAQVYIQKQDLASATDLLTKIMDVYGDKVPPNIQEAQWNATRAFSYGVLASGVYAKKDYPKALELYGKVAKFDNKREDAYYYIGMSKWQSKDPEGAIDAFAKCAALGKTLAKKAQGYLEDLYKARHNNTLDGLDQVLAKAKTELGI
jgi:tetratricopeptide (TPR) repeat protein